MYTIFNEFYGIRLAEQGNKYQCALHMKLTYGIINERYVEKCNSESKQKQRAT